MKKRAIFAICLVSVLGFGFVYVKTFAFFPGKDLKRIRTLEALVDQNVKAGDPPDSVIHFLNSQHLEHSPLMKPDSMIISGHEYRGQNVIAAIKRHVASSLLWDEAVEFVFVFNDKHELTKFDVMPVYTSL